MQNIPNFTISDLLDAGVHFGHKTMRWNPKMSPYIYGVKDKVHIIDLQQTAPLLHNALKVVYDVVKSHGRVLFVGTKRQASQIVAEEAKRCGQYYINYRWLGGTLTNWNTISKSIKTLGILEERIEIENAVEKSRLTKKEKLEMTRKADKLEKSLGGIREIGGRPDLLFVIDTNKENIAIKEANKLGVPVIAILDSNSNPDGVDYPIPGNDDAIRSLRLYCKLVADATLAGIRDSLVESGVDLGESCDVLAELNVKSRKINSKSKNKSSSRISLKEQDMNLDGDVCLLDKELKENSDD